jgi:hypothetical protein
LLSSHAPSPLTSTTLLLNWRGRKAILIEGRYDSDLNDCLVSQPQEHETMFSALLRQTYLLCLYGVSSLTTNDIRWVGEILLWLSPGKLLYSKR